MPDSVLIPAPVSTTIRRASCSNSAASKSCSCRLNIDVGTELAFLVGRTKNVLYSISLLYRQLHLCHGKTRTGTSNQYSQLPTCVGSISQRCACLCFDSLAVDLKRDCVALHNGL